MKTELKRCPFCGGEARNYRHIHLNGYFVAQCETKGCIANQMTYESEDEAIEAWNKRAADKEEKQ